MKKNLSTIIIILLVSGILAFALNPGAEKHREAIKDAVAKRSQLESVLGVGHLKAFASKYKSLGIASYTTIDEKLTSIGVFGIVFVME